MAVSKKIDIQHLETDVPSEIFLRAEELFDNGSIKKVTRQESHLWVLTVLDVTDHEVEVWLSRKGLLKGHSCDCTRNQASSPCSHVVTSLLHIRKNLSTPIKKKAQKQSHSKKVNLPAIFERVPAQEVEFFLSFYAKKDKKFAEAFLLHFADRIITEENDEKYSALLDQIFKTHLTHHNKISNASARYFLKVGRLLQEKIDTLMAFEDYSETINILFPLIRKGHVILKKNNPENNYLKEFIIDVHKLFREFIQLISSPEIIHKVHEQTIELANYSFYNLLSPEDNVFNITLQSQKFNAYHKHIHDRLVDYIAGSDERKTFGLQTLALYYMAQKEYSQIRELFQNYQDTTILFIFISNRMEKADISPQQIIEALHDINDDLWPSTLKIKKARLLIQAYSQSDQIEVALSQTFIYYQKFRKPSILDAYMPKKAPKIKDIKSSLDSQNQIRSDIKKDIYNYFGMRFLKGNRLFNFLKTNTDLNDLINIDPHQLISKSLDLTELYKIKLHAYLSEHFGEQSLSFIYHVLNKTDNYQISGLRTELIEYIHENFPGRISLKELIY